ncbi:MAG TPA: 4Fe-4S ferredoxin [Porphyromonadaceae bacterium]|nr:4Fe-4S ferredoxin [Porphyromonadaceae bacterium]
MIPEVFFTNLRSHSGLNLLDKLEKLLKRTGIEKIDFKDKFVALKVHFGEWGNMAYIRPNYVGRVAKVIKELGGMPYLTDSNTLYKGSRSDAVHHLQCAEMNGFNSITTGCNVIIADGVKGTDYCEIPLPDAHYCKHPKIGTAIADCDVFIALSHFKGHEQSGFGGALKNIGMGSASIGGKLELHSTAQPQIESSLCIGCKMCERNCQQGAIHINESRKAVIDYERCVGCGQCIAVCRNGAAQVTSWTSSCELNYKIDEYTKAVLKDKPCFFVNFIMNVSPECDCWNFNDAAIVPDLGIMASFDPVALDQASVDMVCKAPTLPHSIVEEKTAHKEEDVFTHIHPDTNWKEGLRYAEEIGLGSRKYQLIII